jgi:hypothetical protein
MYKYFNAKNSLSFSTMLFLIFGATIGNATATIAFLY